jgi:aspartyl-tRNA(Asn)/glutamyl-tRNA(Gln) amidotransferase subunit A
MSADQDIAYTSAISLLDLYASRALSPVEVTRRLLDRLDTLQPRINAFCIVDRDGSRTGVRAALAAG